MLEILTITTPIFLLIGLGFLAARSGLMRPEQVRGIGSFVINFALPALMLNALATRPIAEVLNGGYLLAYGGASLAVFALGFAVSRWLRRDSPSGSALSALGMSGSNSGFIGYPVAAMLIGPLAALPMALCMLVECLLVIPLTLILAESERQGGSAGKLALEIARRLAHNRLLIAILGGLSLSALGVQLPLIILRPIEMLAQAAAPAALFVIGATLYGLRPGGMFAEVAQVTLGKLVLHPLAVAFAFSLVPDVDPQLRIAALLFAAAPMFSVYPLLGQPYGLEQRCAATLVVATALSFLSLSTTLAFVTL